MLLLGSIRSTTRICIRIYNIFFSKTYPSFLTVKEGSTSHLGLLPSGKKSETALLGARNRFALRLADHQRSTPSCAGWDRLAIEEDNSAGSATAVTSSASTALVVVQRELKYLGLWKFAGGGNVCAS